MKLRDINSVELAISEILRWGIRISLVLLIAGTILSFASGNYETADMQRLMGIRGEGFPVTTDWLFHGLARLDGAAVIVLGLAILIATPVLRVAVAVLAFIVEKDRVYAAISAFVLLLVCASFFLGVAG
jgi:uncharacterized membrane protein